MKTKLFLYFIGVVVITTIGIKLLNSSSGRLFENLPVIFQMMPFVLPVIILSSLLTFSLLRYSPVKNAPKIGWARIVIWMSIYITGVVALLGLSWVTYYMGAASYAYGERNVSASIHMIWGVAPIVILSSLLTLFVLSLGFSYSHSLKEPK